MVFVDASRRRFAPRQYENQVIGVVSKLQTCVIPRIFVPAPGAPVFPCPFEQQGATERRVAQRLGFSTFAPAWREFGGRAAHLSMSDSRLAALRIAAFGLTLPLCSGRIAGSLGGRGPGVRRSRSAVAESRIERGVSPPRLLRGLGALRSRKTPPPEAASSPRRLLMAPLVESRTEWNKFLDCGGITDLTIAIISIFVEIWKSTTPLPLWLRSHRTTASTSSACWSKPGLRVCRPGKLPLCLSCHRTH